MHLKTSPTGKIIHGHVLDVGKLHFERALKEYDKLLYVKWNPEKFKKWGCWEVRRRPETKTIVDCAEYRGDLYLKLDYHELDVIHHVIDVPFLNYNVITKLQSIDTWKVKNWADKFEYEEKKVEEKRENANRADLKYNLQQHRSIFKDYMEMVKSGRSPAEIAKHWK